MTVYRLTLFLTDGGRTLWDIGNETDESLIKEEYLDTNGLFIESLVKENDIYYAKLDPVRTKKESFYTWEELQETSNKRLECFRTFTICFENPHEKLWFRSDVCDQAFDDRLETPFAVFQGLKNAFYNKVE